VLCPLLPLSLIFLLSALYQVGDKIYGCDPQGFLAFCEDRDTSAWHEEWGARRQVR
jgi:hypothetical protein